MTMKGEKEAFELIYKKCSDKAIMLALDGKTKRANIILFAIYTSSSIISVGNTALGWRVSIVSEIEADCSRLAHGVSEIDSLMRTPSWKCSPSYF